MKFLLVYLVAGVLSTSIILAPRLRWLARQSRPRLRLVRDA